MQGANKDPIEEASTVQKPVSIKMTPRLHEELQAIAKMEGRKYKALVRYFVKIVLGIAREEKEFRITPEHFYSEPLSNDSEKVYLDQDEYEFLENYATEEDLSESELICLFLQTAVEVHRKYVCPGRYLRREAFSQRVQQELDRRWGRTKWRSRVERSMGRDLLCFGPFYMV